MQILSGVLSEAFQNACPARLLGGDEISSLGTPYPPAKPISRETKTKIIVSMMSPY